MKTILISGILFQLSAGLDQTKDVVEEIRNGYPGIKPATFFGVVMLDRHLNDRYSGIMSDRYGNSGIKDFIMTEDSVTFQKFYPNRPAINYAFKKKGNVWHGTWQGPDCGRGTANCVFQETTEEEFFTPTEGHLSHI